MEGNAARLRELHQQVLRKKHLEVRSLAHYFYFVVGKLDEKLDKERVEAYAAQVRYDTATRELAAVNEDLQKMEQEPEAVCWWIC